MKLLLSVLCLSVLIACGDASEGPASLAEAAPSPSPSETVFAESVADAPCDLLTPEAISEAVGVSAEQIQQQEILGSCRYSWDGGTAELARLTLLESADAAQRRFERSYRTPTDDDLARGEAGMREELDRRREEGDLTDRQQQRAEGAAGAIADLAAQTVYEPVADLGDQAVYDGTVHTMETQSVGAVTMAESRVHVRRGNLIASVAADVFDPGRDLAARKAGPSPEVHQRNREVTLALGRALLDRLHDRTVADA